MKNPTAVNAHVLHVGNEDFMFSSHQQMAIYANAIDWDTFDATREVQFNSTSNYKGNTYQIGERPVTITEVRDNIAAIQELSCNCGAVLVGAMGASITSRTSQLKNMSFEDLQGVVKLNASEMNSFFKSDGMKIPSKDALLSYKELSTRIVNQTGGAPAIKASPKAIKVQTQRIEMINKALKK